MATLLPFLYEPPGSRPDVGDQGSLVGHVARNNRQWQEPALGNSLVIVRGPDAYVTPSWYATKREHGRVVPTWNYITAHVYGRLIVHDDPELGRGSRPPVDSTLRGCPDRAMVGRRRSAGLHCRPAPGNRRGRAVDRADRGKGQAQPESLRRRHGRRHCRPRRGSPLGSGRRDAQGPALTLSCPRRAYGPRDVPVDGSPGRPGSGTGAGERATGRTVVRPVTLEEGEILGTPMLAQPPAV